MYVALFNLGDQPQDIDFTFASIGMIGKITVRDLWKKQDVGAFRQSYHQQVNKHGAVLLKLSPQ
jgi:alpha-galactosidase